MTMIEKASAAYGIYSDTVEVGKVVSALNAAGFHNDQVFMMLAPTHPIAAMVRDASFINQPQSTSMTARVIGWLSEFGAVVIPSIGFFIRSQAFFGVLMTARETPALCGNSRTLEGLGFGNRKAERVDSELKKTGFMVYVTSAEAERAQWAADLFEHTGAHESAMLAQAAVAMA